MICGCALTSEHALSVCVGGGGLCMSCVQYDVFFIDLFVIVHCLCVCFWERYCFMS